VDPQHREAAGQAEGGEGTGRAHDGRRWRRSEDVREGRQTGQGAQAQRPERRGAGSSRGPRALSVGEIVKRMLEKGLWQTKGRTPQVTL